jgi:peptidyl-prolyl cis-trans isomerase C
MKTIQRTWGAWKWWLILLGILISAGCGGRNDLPTPTLPGASFTPSVENSPVGETSTPTFIPTPTQTPEPLAAIINGEPITVVEFQAELNRFQQAMELESGTKLATEGATEEMIVIQALIDQVLLAQGAIQAGYLLDEAGLEARYNALAEQSDLSAWLLSNSYTEDSFRVALARSINAAWMRDQIILNVPVTAEQVHARQILLYHLEDANQVYANLRSGGDFDRVATLYDPIGKGDIGWFPRDYLTEAEIEQAAFGVQPGEMSAIIETRLGFHILKVIERDPARILEPDALLALQALAVQHWLDETKSTSEIQVLLP